MQEFRNIKCDGTIQDYGVFNNISELHQYITENPANETFTRYERQSRYTHREFVIFSRTKSFEEACSLLVKGWDQGAKELDQKVEAYFKGSKVTSQSQQIKRKTIYDVAGYQVSVPRYLNGVPDSMVRTKMIPVKNKILTINKIMGYRADVNPQTILDESAKALAIVKRLEDMGYRVNVNIVNLSKGYSRIEPNMLGLKVRVKNANERLNISKLAFTMCHPGMMRRIIFGFKEVFPGVTSDFGPGYGASIYDIKRFSKMCKGEYVITPFIDSSILDAKELNIEQFKV